MAMTASLVTSGARGNEVAEVTGFTTASITPGADCVLVFLMSAVGTTTNLHDTGHTVVSSGSGPTWTKRAFFNTASTFHEMGVVWTAVIGGTDPGSFTVTIDWPSTAAARYVYTIHKVTGTFDAADPVGACAATGGAAGNGAITVTLPWSPSTNDITFALTASDVGTAGGATFGTGTWTETYDGLGSGLQIAGNSGYRTGSTSSAVPWSDVNVGGAEESFTSGQAVCVIREATVFPYLAGVGALQAEASTTTLGPMVIPPQATTNDIMVMPVMLNAGGTFSTPTDWTQFGTLINSANQSSNWFWKRHDGSETNPSTTTSVTMSSTIGGYGRIYVIRNCITTGTPFEDVTMAGTPTLDTTPASAAIDTTGANELAVSFVVVDDDNSWSSGNPPALWTIFGSRVTSTTGGDAMFDAISRQMASAGSVAAVTIGTQSASDYWRSLTLAFIPPAGGTDATATPAALASVVTFPAATVQTGWTVNPGVLAATASLPAAAAGAAATGTPAPLAATATFPSVTAKTGWTPAPAALTATATLPAAQAKSGWSASPAVLATTATLPAVTAKTGWTTTPAALAATTTFPAVAVSGGGGATVAPAALAVLATFPAVSVQRGWSAVPAVLTTVATLPAVVPSVAATAVPGVLATLATFPAVTAGAGAIGAPSPLLTVATFPAVTAKQGSTATPASLIAVVTFPAATAKTGWTTTPSPLLAVATFPAVTAGAGAVATPAVKLAVVTFPAVTASGAISATVSPVALLVAATFPAVTARYGWTATPTPLLVVVDLPMVFPPGGLTPTITGPLDTFRIELRRITEATYDERVTLPTDLERRLTDLLETERTTLALGESRDSMEP